MPYPPDAAPRPLHARLREATAEAHQTLEHTLGLLEQPATVTRFVALLMRLHGFHRVWEPALRRALPDDGEFLAARRRLPMIEDDLRELDIDDLDIAALPVLHAAVGLCRTPEAALGSLYVIEGSTLGGRVIDRQLRDQARWYPAGGLLTFHPYGDSTGQRWNETLDRLEAVPPDAHAAVVEGALDTFALLLQWLAPALSAPDPADFDNVPSEWGVAL